MATMHSKPHPFVHAFDHDTCTKGEGLRQSDSNLPSVLSQILDTLEVS